MTDLRKLVAESQEHRPKTDLGGVARTDWFSLQPDEIGDREQLGKD